MQIAFTGHRNKIASLQDLENIHRLYPAATWVHGGAGGFDSQVAAFAQKNGIGQIVIRPDYGTHGRSAPLIRNREIVNRAAMLYACYDGRQSGGTYYTINYAQKRIPVHVLSPVQNVEK
jgi:hypothetical protein